MPELGPDKKRKISAEEAAMPPSSPSDPNENAQALRCPPKLVPHFPPEHDALRKRHDGSADVVGPNALLDTTTMAEVTDRCLTTSVVTFLLSCAHDVRCDVSSPKKVPKPIQFRAALAACMQPHLSTNALLLGAGKKYDTQAWLCGGPRLARTARGSGDTARDRR